jgi:Lhr-like helicase
MQKIKLARVGGKEARSLLIKERNRIVASSVLASPKITETEIITFAQSRSIGDELLRIIASNREWTKTYQVKLALCSNPKTPIPQAVKFLNYLQERDLRILTKSKDVPSNISNHARRILTKKGKL